MEIKLERRAESITQQLRLLGNARPLYILPTDPLAEEVLIPGFRNSGKVDCMVGFFSSEVLSSLAPGLASYISESKNILRLIMSPLLRDEDRVAIEEGLKSVENITDGVLEDLFVSQDMILEHTLKCLTWLLREKRIEIKIALMKKGFFHPKVWLFKNTGDVVAAHGSGNATFAGINNNIEQFVISRSWQDPNQRYITEKLLGEFDALWEDKNENCIIIPISHAVKERLLETYSSDSIPTENQLRSLYHRAKNSTKSFVSDVSSYIPRTEFKIPNWLNYESGPYEHQAKAVNAWCDAQYHGILEMATGSGKTIASMIGAYHLSERHTPLLVVVAVPYVPLIEQWYKEISQFGLNPVNLNKVRGTTNRAKILNRIRRRIRTKLSCVEVIVTTHSILCTKEFQSAVEEFSCFRLLIADEVHSLGRRAFIEWKPDFFEFRLGLSATPVRQYDEEGTSELHSFFGPVVFSYSLEEAIGHCLVEYDYYLHPVYLTESEMDTWYGLTDKIKRNSWRSNDKNPDEYLSKLLRDRRALLETASGKVSMLESLLKNDNLNSLRHTLVYTSDKGREQLNKVNQLLRDKNILYHQLTSEETANREKTNRIIKSFQEGEIQVLTAMRVLDEGVNIPQISMAYFLASTTIERQWIQRRGRLLRTCNDVGKTHSVIHDLLALPQGIEKGLDPDAQGLVRSELSRAMEFAKLARNAGRPSGPLAMISKMVTATYQ